MGSPQVLAGSAYAQLEKAGQLTELKSVRVNVREHKAELKIVLARQAVALMEFEF